MRSTAQDQLCIPAVGPRACLGPRIALSIGMRTIARFLNAALLSAAMMIPVAIAPTVLAQDHKDRTYHDKKYNDDHQWNNHEDRAYRMYVKENHHHYHDFNKLNENDQQAYWGWRHEHSDAVLKIDIR